MGAILIAGIGLDIYLLLNERIAENEAQMRHKADRADPLLDIHYSKSEREVNLARYGFQGDDLALAMKTLQTMDTEKTRMRIAMFLDEVGDPDGLADALCGVGRERVGPRYSAMAWLVDEQGGRRDPIDPKRASGFEEHKWAAGSPIGEVFAEVEMDEERMPDATIMGVAAILLEREQDVLDRRSPWARGLGGRWSWDRVKEGNPGILERVARYLLTFHLVMEQATADEGFCGE